MHTFCLTSVGAGLPCANVDSQIASWFRERLTPVWADVLLALSGPGSGWCVTVLALLLVAAFAWKQHWYGLFTLLLIVPCGAMVGELLKVLIQRERPFAGGPFGEWGGYSFPSGHTLCATLIYGFLMVLLAPLSRRKRWRWGLFSAGVALILGVGFSRIALGAHYLTDVIGGMVLGTVWVGLCWMGVTWVQRRQMVNAEAIPAVERNENAPVMP